MVLTQNIATTGGFFWGTTVKEPSIKPNYAGFIDPELRHSWLGLALIVARALVSLELQGSKLPSWSS